ncbi:9354_t:CDS:2 [Racocetra fulgida]|uniref:9354_t:CDS:1 n=1 Tax=Racocetra fulgida TaxID=60492 RepID=A0A9N9BA80_9GLOM|nr:9354_t:CDS:2 [Racocetra fulgida]
MIFMDNKKIKISNPAFLELNIEVSSSVSLQRDIVFLDPEVIKNRYSELTSASDIYSLGVIMWSISSRKFPFEGITDQKTLVDQIVVKNVREQPDNNISPTYSDLYQRCWYFDRSNRPTMDVVCKQLEVMLQEEQNPDSILDAPETSQRNIEASEISQRNIEASEISQQNNNDPEIPGDSISYNGKSSGKTSFRNMFRIKSTRKSKEKPPEKLTRTSNRKFLKKKSLINCLKMKFKTRKKASEKAPEEASEETSEKKSKKSSEKT